MTNIVIQLVVSTMAFAGEGSGHSHGPGGETEHLWPVLAIFALLVVGGLAFNFFSKKKK